MFSIKEQAETYRLGLLIGYFKVEDVIHWSDSTILNEDIPDIGVINVSYAESKGINEVIATLENVKGKIDTDHPTKALLGLIFKKFISQEETVYKTTRKLYTLSQYISPLSISEDILYELISMEDVFSIYGEKSVSLKILELLKCYEVFADDFINSLSKNY